MICECGMAVPAAQAKGLDGTCPACSKPLRPDVEEILSVPALGIVREVRPGQIELAKLIDGLLKDAQQQSAFVVGGCGIGKTFSYLIPLMLRGRRFVVSTAKKALQDQLGSKDVPYLLEKLKLPYEFVSIKGKSNYVCLRLLLKQRQLFDQNGKTQLREDLLDWQGKHVTGDLNAFPGELEFPATLCTADECIGGGCPHKRDCGYYRNKSKVKDATVVIANHSLVGFDLAYEHRVLGEYDTLVVDEGHSFPEYARGAFSQEVSQTWLKNFVSKMAREGIAVQGNEKDYYRDWDDMFEAIPQERLLDPGFIPQGHLDRSLEILDALRHDIKDSIKTRWGHMGTLEELMLKESYWESFPDEAGEFHTAVRMTETLGEKYAALEATASPEDNMINCREETARGKVKLRRQPVELAPHISAPLRGIPHFVMTSATLNFDMMKAELGVTPNLEIVQPSPFNYRVHGLMYLPKHLPLPPDREEWIPAVGNEIVQLIRMARGNTLVLFTARRDLEDVYEYIGDNFGLPYPIFAQVPGRRPNELFDSFMQTDNAVLMGLKSFFEGIDVPGGKLRLVILTKIPFPQREDPLAQAKERILGKQFWHKYYFPMMLTDIQQAVGRLIRTATDKGVVAILDPRIWVGGNKNLDPMTVGTQRVPWRGYGFQIFKALPFEQFTPDANKVKTFFDIILS